MRILLITNDFPPRVGGIQNYLWNIYSRFDPDDVVVLAPSDPEATRYDRGQRFEIVRAPGAVYWPTRRVKRLAKQIVEARNIDAVAFGAVLPMNLIGDSLGVPVVVHTHGFEVAWARVPPLRRLLRRIGRNARLITVIADYTRAYMERGFGDGAPIHLLRTGVDLERFNPAVDGTEARKRHDLGDEPLVVCTSRLVKRKGQDTLIRAMPLVREKVPGAKALIVGGGPYRRRLEQIADQSGVYADGVVFAGEVSERDLAAHYAAGDVFAMPCRSRWADLEVEGLGIVYLEAQACGRPAIAGDSGGAPEAIMQRETGFVVPGRDEMALAVRLVELLSDRDRARSIGDAGRRFVEQNHRWEDVVARYRAMLETI